MLLGALLWWLAPESGTDRAAQVARSAFARAAPLTPVDLSWYSGTHPYGYSVLAPAVMAVLGVGLAGLLAAVAAAALLGRLLRGTERPLLGSLLGAVFCVADVASGRTTFALGAVAALGALVALPRRGRAAGLAVLTALLSPVAAAFLGLAAAVLVLHGRAAGWTLGVAAALPVVVVAALFPAGGVQPFRTSSAWWAVAAGLLLAVLTDLPLLRTGGLLYAGAVLILVVTRDPFGSNVLRLGLLLAAPLVAATARRRSLVVLAVAAALLQWQARPTLADLRAPAPPPTRTLERALARLEVRRVEIVPLRDHGETATVGRTFVLARGWSRQTDRQQDALFYDGTLTAARFTAWLHEHSVDVVALAPRAALDVAGRREAALLAGPVPGLVVVFEDRTWTVWKVVNPVPLAARPLRVVASRPTRLVVQAGGPASGRVDVRWSRWLSVSGPACLERDGDRVRLRFRSAGIAVLGSGLTPRGHC